MSILELQGISYSYDRKKDVLKEIDAEMEVGKMYAILGPSPGKYFRRGWA